MPVLTYFALGFTALWCMAVLVKVATSWRSGGYVFGIWDGGWLLGGKRLGRLGTAVYGAAMLALLGCDAYLLSIATQLGTP